MTFYGLYHDIFSRSLVCGGWHAKLGPISFSPLTNLSAKLLIITLDVLEAYLLLLSFLDGSRLQVDAISAIPGIRRYTRCGMLDRRVHHLTFTIVPVAHTIEVEVADVITCDFTYTLTIAENLAVHVVRFLEQVGAVVNVGCQAILNIAELFTSYSLLPERAHE